MKILNIILKNEIFTTGLWAKTIILPQTRNNIFPLDLMAGSKSHAVAKGQWVSEEDFFLLPLRL